MSRQDAIAKAGGETFNLGFDALAHIESWATGDMAVGPHGVFPLRRAGGVKQALLREQHERLFGMLTAPDRGFARRDFWQRAAQVYSCGAPALRRSPGDGAVERQVEFEDAGAIAITLQFVLVTGRQARTGDA